MTVKGSDTFAGAPYLQVNMVSAPTPSQEMSDTLEPGEMGYSGWHVMGRSAWWRFIPQTAGDVSLNLFKSEVSDWYALGMVMLAVYTGDTLETLTRVDYSFSSDYWYEEGSSNLGYSPEILLTVEPGVTYHVQAMLRQNYNGDTSYRTPDIDYRLQVSEYSESWSAWVQPPDYDYDVPLYTQSDGRTVANFGGDSKMYDQIQTIWSDYVANPSPAMPTEMLRQAQARAHAQPQNNTWSTESLFASMSIGDNPALPGGQWWESDPSRRNYGAAYREFHYARRDADALRSHRYWDEGNYPDNMIDYEDENDAGAVAVGAQVVFRLDVNTTEGGGMLGTPQFSPATVTHKVQLRTGSQPLPAFPQETRDQYGSDMDAWTHDRADTVLHEHPIAENVTTKLIPVDMTPYINADGTFVFAACLSDGTWANSGSTEVQYGVNMKAELDVYSCRYRMHAPRRHYLVRTYAGDYAVPEITGRPDNVRRRFARSH